MSVMSTKMELSKEVEKILNKARSLNLRNDTQFRNIRPSSSSSTSTECSMGILSRNYEDESDLDIIDVNSIDLADDETWLCLPEKSSNIKNVYQWLRRDVDEMKDVKYQTQQLLLQYEMTCLNTTMNNHIDSRTFTRPKKKITRPSLETVNSTFKFTYQNSKIDDTSSFSQPTNDYPDLKARLSNARRDPPPVLSNTPPKNIESSTNIENIIREQMKLLEIRDTYKTENVDVISKIKSTNQNSSAIGDFVQNASPPPTLMMNSFGSSNFTSLTESDFITAINQPQDLYTSYTSTIATDDQNTDFTDNETFAKDVQNMCETFCNDIHDRTFVNVDANSVNDTFIAASDDSLDKTRPNYFKSQNIIKDSGPEAISFENKREIVKTDILNNTFTHNISKNITQTQIQSSNESNLNNSSDSCMNASSEQDFAEKSHSESVNDTFIKLSSANNKISLSDPNLLDQKKSEKNLLNQTFDMTKMAQQNHNLSDSLELTSSYSSLNSSKAGNNEEFKSAEMIERNKCTYQRVESTPKLRNLTFKKTWASTEALSPISHLTTRELLKVKETSSETTRSMPTSTFVKNMKSDAKTLNLVETKMKRPSSRHAEKPNSTYSLKTEPISGVKDAHIPTMIVKPMEVKRCPPVTADNSAEVQKSVQQNGTSNSKQSMLKQPAVRSALPRPASSGSGIPRPQSRLPVPRSLRPPTSISKPAPIKNNWMDGCY